MRISLRVLAGWAMCRGWLADFLNVFSNFYIGRVRTLKKKQAFRHWKISKFAFPMHKEAGHRKHDAWKPTKPT